MRRSKRRGVKRERGGSSSAEEQLMRRVKNSQKRRGGGRYKNFLDTEKVADLQFWRPSKETHLFDIIPYKAGSQDIEVPEGEFAYTCQVRVHTGIGPNKRDRYVCLAEHFNRPCPICEDQEELRNEGVDDEIVNVLYPRTRYLYNVHVLTNNKERRKGVQILDVAANYLEDPITEKAQTFVRKKKKMIEKYTNFPAPSEEGKTIKVKIGTKTVPMGGKPTQIPDWAGHDFIDRDEPLSRKILKQAQVLDELLYVPTYEEVYDAYHHEGGDGDEGGTSRKSKSKKSKKDRGKKRKDKKTQKIEAPDAFGDEDELLDYLQGLSEKQLEKFIEKNDVDVDIDELDEEEIVEAIMEEFEGYYDDGGENEEEDEEEDDEGGEEDECPEGYEFGVDCNDYDECQECPEDIYDACYEAKHGDDEG